MLKRVTLKAAANFRKSSWGKWWRLGTIAMVLPVFLAVSGLSSVPAEKAGQLFPHTKLSGIELSSQLLAQKERRTALVIGNGAYDAGGRLNNPPNDADDVAKALEGLGFKVTKRKNLDKQQMADEIEQFNRQLLQGGVGLFYYAGHGVQVDGKNYLIPINAKINREQDIDYKTIPLEQVVGAMEEAGNPVNIVILDACRDNPTIRRFKRTLRRGLAPPQREPEGMLIAYSTAPGAVAEDGDGRNSPYTASLLQYIQEPGVPIQLMFEKVQQSVSGRTGRRQSPRYTSSIGGNFAFKPAESISPPSPNPATPAPSLPQPTVAASPTPSLRPVAPTPSPKPSPNAVLSSPSPSPMSPSVIPTLPSEPRLTSKTTGVNYDRLRDLLAAGQWQEADAETRRTILKAVGRERMMNLSYEDIEKFPCEDLRTINQLWVTASGGKFGFSVQKQIYYSLEGSWEFDKDVWSKFIEQVRWSDVSRYDFLVRDGNSSLTFSKEDPKGHLPYPVFPGGLDANLFDPTTRKFLGDYVDFRRMQNTDSGAGLLLRIVSCRI